MVTHGEDSQAATKFTTYAGGGGKGISVDLFRPKDIFIHAGDTIEWVNPYEEIHTVTFTDGKEAPAFIIPAGPPPAGGPPKLIINPEVSNKTTQTTYTSGYANSGVLGKGQTYSLGFTKTGTYAFLCVLHPNMTGTVHVLNDGTTVPTQAALDFEAKATLDAGIEAGLKSVAATKPANAKNADGTTNWGLAVPNLAGDSTPMAFVPNTVSIGLGDSVTWTNNTFVPHTVTYTAGQPAPGFAVPEFQASGPPIIALDPKVVFPVNAGKNFSGDAYVNSGFFGPGPESTAPPQFTLTFNKAGTYLFICVLHADQGMSSVVQVGSTRSGVTPPSTGDAGLAGGTTPVEFTAGVALVALIALSLGAYGLNRR